MPLFLTERTYGLGRIALIFEAAVLEALFAGLRSCRRVCAESLQLLRSFVSGVETDARVLQRSNVCDIVLCSHELANSWIQPLEVREFGLGKVHVGELHG